MEPTGLNPATMFGGPGTLFTGTSNAPPSTFNVAQGLGLKGGPGQLVNMAVQNLIPKFFGEGYQFGQFSPQMNLYEQLRRQSAYAMQREVVTDAATTDSRQYEKILQGFANLTGTPYGRREQAAAATMARDLSSLMPMLAQAAPELVDRLHGSRGSAMVMSQRIADTSRYMTDPLTGGTTMSKENVKALSKNIFENLYGEKADVREMRGIRAGQAGAMFDEMTRRGLVSSAPRSLKEIAQAQKTTVDALMNAPDLDSKIQQFEANKIVDKLKGMSRAVAAMKDVFGENGRPDAPMNEIFNALQQVTQNNLSAMQPEKIEKVVREFATAARSSGMGLQGMMALNAQSAQAADRFGLDRSFAPGIATNAALFSRAYGDTYGNVRGFGVMDKEKATMANVNLQAAAAASPQAQSLAALMRLSRSGAIDKSPQNEELNKYIEDIKAGKSPELMGEDKLVSLLQNAGVSQGQFFALRRQTTSNQADIAQNKLDEIASKAQTQQAKTIASQSFGTAFLDMANLDDKTRSAMADTISARLVNMSPEEAQMYANADLSFLENDVAARYKAETGKTLDATGMRSLRMAMEQGRGSIDSRAAERGLDTGINMFSLTSEKVRKQQQVNKQINTAEANLSSEMSKLGRAGPMERITDAIAYSTEGRDLGDFLRDVFGGISDEQIEAAKTAGLGTTLQKAAALNKRIVAADSESLAKLLPMQSMGPMSKEDTAKLQDVLEANDLTTPEGQALVKQMRGKTPEEISSLLRTNRANVRRVLLQEGNRQLEKAKIDKTASGLSKDVLSGLRLDAQANKANAGTNAISVSEAIFNDEGTMNLLTKAKSTQLSDQLRESGEAYQTATDARINPNDTRVGDPTVAKARRGLQATILKLQEADTAIKLKAKEKGQSEEGLRDKVMPTVEDLKNIQPLLQEKNKLQAEAKNAPEGSKAKEEAQNKLLDLERQIKAKAQNAGYSASFILQKEKRKEFDSATPAQKSESETIRKLFADRQSSSENFITAYQDSKDLAKAKGFDIGVVLGDSATAKAFKSAAATAISALGSELQYYASRGGVVRTQAEAKEIKDEQKRRQIISGDPAVELKKTLIKLNKGQSYDTGVDASFTEAIKNASPETVARYAETIENLDALASSGPDGSVPMPLKEIIRLKEASLDPRKKKELDKLSEARKKQINRLDLPILKQAEARAFTLKEEAKVQSSKSTFESATATSASPAKVTLLDALTSEEGKRKYAIQYAKENAASLAYVPGLLDPSKRNAAQTFALPILKKEAYKALQSKEGMINAADMLMQVTGMDNLRKYLPSAPETQKSSAAKGSASGGHSGPQVVKLAENTKMEGTIDLTTGTASWVVNPASKA